MKKYLYLLPLCVLLSALSFTAKAQDSLQVDKKKMEKLIKLDIKQLEPKYRDGYKEGRLTWSYPEKVAKDELITVEYKLDGEIFLMHDYDPVTYKFRSGIDLR